MMTMLASKPVKKGQEIFNDYGQRPRSDLLRRYGYITDNARKWDVVELDLETMVQTACKHKNLDESEKERRVPYSSWHLIIYVLKFATARVDQRMASARGWI